MGNKAVRSVRTAESKELVKMIEDLGQRHSCWQVFSDFVTMMAVSISNAVDPTHREKREEIYKEAAGRYSAAELDQFPVMFAALVEQAETAMHQEGPRDILGELFHALELHNKYKGQFFTPQSIADAMAQISITPDHVELAEKGHITMCEPTCGSGVMVLAAARVMLKAGLNPSQQVVVLASDLDFKCTCMAYVQLSLYGIPAVVEHANTLTCEVYSRWYTPAYIWGGWVFREHMGITSTDGLEEDERLKIAQNPLYAAFRMLGKVSRATGCKKCARGHASRPRAHDPAFHGQQKRSNELICIEKGHI